MATAQEVAYYLLNISCPECGDYMSNLKLQKLLYYVQGVHLAVHGRPLFDEEIKNWEHGPVVPSVYHEFKDNGGAAIIAPESGFDVPEFSEEEITTMNDVYDFFGQYSAWKLRDMTHEEIPWKSTNRNDVIPNELIQKYFVEHIMA